MAESFIDWERYYNNQNLVMNQVMHCFIFIEIKYGYSNMNVVTRNCELGKILWQNVVMS